MRFGSESNPKMKKREVERVDFPFFMALPFRELRWRSQLNGYVAALQRDVACVGPSAELLNDVGEP